MSSLSNSSSTPGHQIVQLHSVRSAISHPESRATRIAQTSPDSGILERWNALQQIKEAYRTGHMSRTEYRAAFDRIAAAELAHSRRLDEFAARSLSGQTEPGDFYREVYGYTEEETEQAMQAGMHLLETHSQNESRCRSRILQNSKGGRGH